MTKPTDIKRSNSIIPIAAVNVLEIGQISAHSLLVCIRNELSFARHQANIRDSNQYSHFEDLDSSIMVMIRSESNILAMGGGYDAQLSDMLIAVLVLMSAELEWHFKDRNVADSSYTHNYNQCPDFKTDQ